LVLIFFLIWSSFSWLQFLLFSVLFLINCFFDNLISYCLISLDFHFIFDAYVFYHAFKTWPESQPCNVPSHKLGWVIGVTRINQVFFIVQEVKMIFFYFHFGSIRFFYCVGSKNVFYHAFFIVTSLTVYFGLIGAITFF